MAPRLNVKAAKGQKEQMSVGGWGIRESKASVLILFPNHN